MPKVATSKEIFLLGRYNESYSTVTTSFTKLVQDLFLTFIMIFDIPLCTVERYITSFFFRL